MTSVQRANKILESALKRTVRVRAAAAQFKRDLDLIDTLTAPLGSEIDFFDYEHQPLEPTPFDNVPYSVPEPIDTTSPWDLPGGTWDTTATDLAATDSPAAELYIPELVALLGPQAIAANPELIPFLPEIALSLAAAGVLYGSYKAGQALGRHFKTRPGHPQSPQAPSPSGTRAGSKPSSTYFGPNHGNTL